jgi:recombination protein RecA
MAKTKAVKVDKKRDNSDADAQLALAEKAIIKKYGDVISTLSDHGDIIIPTISTGCMSLDIALGNGGMGLGRIYEVYGPESSGKSTLAVNVVIQAQRRGLRACYIDAEHAVDPNLFGDYGVNKEELKLVQGFDAEQNLDALEMLVRSGAFSVAVVDSVAALIPRDEAEADIDKDSIALQARLMSKALRRITPMANQTGTLVIFINQERKKIVLMGNPKTTAGGESLPYYATGRISIKGPEAVSRHIKDDLGEVVGHRAEFLIKKNKLAAPFKTAAVKLIYGKGYDTHWEVLDMAESVGVVDKRGAWYKYNDENFAQGERNAADFLKAPENEELFNKIRNEVVEVVGLKETYERHSNPGPLYS